MTPGGCGGPHSRGVACEACAAVEDAHGTAAAYKRGCRCLPCLNHKRSRRTYTPIGYDGPPDWSAVQHLVPGSRRRTPQPATTGES